MISIRFALNPRFSRISSIFIVSLVLIGLGGVYKATAAVTPTVLVQGAPIQGAGGIMFDSDDRLHIASLNAGGRVVVMDAETGKILDSLVPGKAPNELTFGPDGSLYWTSLIRGEVGRLSVDGVETIQMVAMGVNPITFSDDGRLFVALDFMGDALYELDPELVNPPRLIAENLGFLNGMDWGSDGFLYGPIITKGQVVRVNVDTGEITPVSEGLGNPNAVRFDSQGRLHVTDTGKGEVSRIDIETGNREVIATGLYGIHSLAFDSHDRLFISSHAEGFIVEVLPDGKKRTVSPGGMILPMGVAVLPRADGGESVFVADLHTLKEFDGLTGEQLSINRNSASPITVSSDGKHLVLSSWYKNAVLVWNPETGKSLEEYRDFAVPINAIRFQGDLVVAELGTGSVVRMSAADPAERVTLVDAEDGLAVPAGLTATDDDLWVSDWATGMVLQLVADGQPLEKPIQVATGLAVPEGMAVAPDGSLLIVEAGAGRLSRIDLATGEVSTVGEVKVGNVYTKTIPPVFNDVAVGPSGTIYITSYVENQVFVIRPPEPPPVEPPPPAEMRWVVMERMEVDSDVGAEHIVFDDEGRLYASMMDGNRVMRFQPDGSQPEVFAEVSAAGLQFDADGNLLVCNTAQELLSIAPDGSTTVLSTGEVGAEPVHKANSVDVAADGTIYFSDATFNLDPEEDNMVEILENPGPYGRLFAYYPETKTTRMLLDGLWFANGVAVSPDQSFVLVDELTGSRVTRYWLTGPKQGESDTFVELPTMPDNITTNGKDMFWVAGPWGYIFGLDMDGNIVHHLRVLDPSGNAYGWLTGVTEHEGMLYLANPKNNAIGLLSLDFPAPGPDDFTNIFFMNLTAGLNMVSLPLKPITPYTARSFAGRFSATMVIQFDEARQRFVGFTNDAPDDGFDIEGGKGYIVNVPKDRMVTFAGAAWTNQPPVAAPSVIGDGAWAFVVSGKLDVEYVANLFHVTVRNTRTNAVATDVVRKGYFAAAFADLTRKNVVQTGDRLEVQVKNATGEIASETFTYTVTPETIRQAFMPIILKNVGIPHQNLLLQNYPNPFNPETWIPYQLREPAEVMIRIYDVKGQLAHTIDLGQRAAGFYLGRTKAAYWDGKNEAGEKVASGVYFYQIKTGDFTATRRMVIVK